MVGYGEMDLNGRCKISAILNYLQEVATLHSKKYGYGTEEMQRLKMGWLLLSWKIKIYKYPLAEQEVEVRTWCRGNKGLHAMRGYEVYNNKSELIIVADSNWVLYDLEKQKPLKILPDMEKAYGTIDRKPFENETIKIEVPSIVDSSLEYRVMRHDIDTNRHINNVRYVDLLLDNIPEEEYTEKTIDTLEIMYKKQAFYNDNLTITCTKILENEYVNTIINNNNEVCTIIKTLWK
jgi:medium-chain acyl-[acyl-carrier-protein] hydrolase